MSKKRDRRPSVEPLERRRLLAAALDPSFGVGGVVVTDILPAEPGPDEAVAVVPMPDGRVVTVGRTLLHEMSDFPDYRGVVTRYHANGIVDSTFAGGGSKIITLGNSFGAMDAERLADGSVLVLGSRGDVVNQQFEDNGHIFFEHVQVPTFMLVRITTDGVIGATEELGGLEDIQQMLRQGDGKILITAIDKNDPDNPYDQRAVVIRLNADGSHDTAFGADGTALAPAAIESPYIRSLAIRGDGKIILGEDADRIIRLAQLNANGTTDTSFGGGDGVIDLDNPTWTFTDVTAAPDGGFYAAASKRGDSTPLSLVKLTAGGAIDPNFTISDFPAGVVRRARLLVQPDGKILASANSEDAAQSVERVDPIFVRFNANGTLDTTFGPAGALRVVSDQENNSRVSDMAFAVTPAGAVYAAGTADARFLTLRITESFAPPPAGGVAATIIGDTLHVIGTIGNDVIAIRSAAGNKIEVLSAGTLVNTFDTAAVKRIAAIGDAGNDVIDARDLAAIVTAGVDFPVTIDGAAGRDVLVGSQGRDRITGGDDNDRIAGWDGDDWLSGNAQKDRIDGGLGNDSIFGNGGRDSLGGNVGNDTLFGGDQPDFLTGWTGDDSLEGGGGHDRIDGGAGKDTLAGGGGDDRLFARDNEIDHVIGGYLRFDRAEVDEDDLLVNIEQLL